MVTDHESIRVQLNYPDERVAEPILYHLVERFQLVPNIRKAQIDLHGGGFIFLELTGARDRLDAALTYLEGLGITVSTIGVDGTQEWGV